MRRFLLGVLFGATTVASFAQQPQIGPRSVNISTGTPHYAANFTISVDSCEIVSGMIRCQLAVRHNGPRETTDQSAKQFIRNMRLYDDANAFHMRRSGSFVNGRGVPVDFANFSRGDVLSYIVEFDGGTPDIKTARLVMPNRTEIKGIAVRPGRE